MTVKIEHLYFCFALFAYQNYNFELIRLSATVQLGKRNHIAESFLEFQLVLYSWDCLSELE